MTISPNTQSIQSTRPSRMGSCPSWCEYHLGDDGPVLHVHTVQVGKMGLDISTSEDTALTVDLHESSRVVQGRQDVRDLAEALRQAFELTCGGESR